MQETCLAIWRAAAAFAGAAEGGTAVGWVWTIAARRLVDALRRRARQAQAPPAALSARPQPAEDEVLDGVMWPVKVSAGRMSHRRSGSVAGVVDITGTAWHQGRS